MSALSASGVRKAYGEVRALDGIDFEVAPGECVALVGESGSGKTTLLRCFNRMVAPDAGVVRVDGLDVATQDPVALRRRLGYVQQDGGLLPHWNVLRNVGLVPGLLGLTDAVERVARSLALVGLPIAEFGARWPRQLSGGQRQRVALARALAAEPKVVLLDEPFGALDAITRGDLQRAFAGVVATLGVSVLLVTHDLREAFLLADRVAVMRAGRIEQLGTPDQLRDEPCSPYVTELLERADLATSDRHSPTVAP